MLANVAANYLASGEVPGRYGNGHPNIVPYRTFRAADGEVALAVGNDDQFRKLAALLDSPQWADDPRYARNRDRVKNRDLIDNLIQDKFAARTRAEWIEALDRIGIPSGPINNVAEALSSPQTLARDMVTEIDHPLVGMIRMLGLPIRFDGTPSSIRSHPPALGEHTAAILEELLGMSGEEIDDLGRQGIV